jgi:hypothetical protein
MNHYLVVEPVYAHNYSRDSCGYSPIYYLTVTWALKFLSILSLIDAIPHGAGAIDSPLISRRSYICPRETSDMTAEKTDEEREAYYI